MPDRAQRRPTLLCIRWLSIDRSLLLFLDPLKIGENVAVFLDAGTGIHEERLALQATPEVREILLSPVPGNFVSH